MEKFKLAQSELLKRAKEKKACADEYKRAASANTEADLLKVIFDNLKWCVENDILSPDYFNAFTPEVFYASGIANVGKENTGYSNTGSWNTGYRNTGDRNTGDRNTGYRNTGDRNTGDRNTGSWNTGDRNTGYSNTGDRNTGVFCTGEPETLKFFNKDSDITEQEFLNSRAYTLLCEVNTKIWVDESIMSTEEKEKYPAHKTAGGYVKDIPFKDAFANSWYNWNEERRRVFTSLPNFDASIFEQITSVKL